MKKRRLLTNSGRLLVACLFIISLLVISLTVMAQELTTPQSMPSSETGLDIFSDRCVNCHGPFGQGDGELTANLPAPPPSFADPEFRQTTLPMDMYEQIFFGDFVAGMPPFGPGTESTNPIPEADIWNLVAAVYSLSTPTDSVTQGQVIYEENCVSCHGETGLGDDPEAAGLDPSLLDLTNLNYWFNRSNEMVLADLQSGAISEHNFDLSEGDQWMLVDYARTFSYVYSDPLAPLPPISSGTISGLVQNGSTGNPVVGATATLRAFTTSFEQTLSMTTTTDIGGSYRFELEQVPPDWVYLANVNYQDLSFSSDAGQLNRTEPELNLPIIVYEKTNNADAVTIDQMHVILDFFEGGISVTELYVFSNQETAVFVGDSGVADDGTIQVALPEGAQDIGFERTLGSFENTIPATEFIQTQTGWADTLPLLPGPGGLNLIVQYNLPYEDEVNLSHKLMYNTSRATIILPDVGIELNDGDGWTFQGAQQMPTTGASFQTYNHSELAAGSTILMNISGRFNLATNSTSINLAGRNQTSELLIGGGVLLIAAAVGVYVVRSWSTKTEADDSFQEFTERNEIIAMLQAIADLDDAFHDGQINEKDYRAKRNNLKAELRAVWNE